MMDSVRNRKLSASAAGEENNKKSRGGSGESKSRRLPLLSAADAAAATATVASFAPPPLSPELQLKFATTQLLQWQLLNAEARQAFAAREAGSLSALSAAAELVGERQRTAAEMRHCNRCLATEAALDEVVAAQLSAAPVVLRHCGMTTGSGARARAGAEAGVGKGIERSPSAVAKLGNQADKLQRALRHRDRRARLVVAVQEASDTVHLKLHEEEEEEGWGGGALPPPLVSSSFSSSCYSFEPFSEEVLENGLTSLAERCQRLEACGAALSPEQAKSAAASALRLSERAHGLRRALARVGAKGAKLHERHTEVASLAISLAIPRR
jgi:hypothetical protein